MKFRSGNTMNPDMADDEESFSSPQPESGDANQVKSRGLKIFGFVVNPTVFIVHLNVCLYAACFWIQIGALPYLSKKLGVDPVVFGYLQTVFAVMQLAGGPVFGRFGDLYGGRAALTLAFSSAALSYFLMAISVNIPLLFLSRTASIFLHVMQAGQMVVTDVCDSDKRADALGKLGLSYGIGMVIGPVIGGVLTKHYSEEFATSVACVGSLISIVICLYSIPTHTKRIHTTEKDVSSSAVFNPRKYLTLIKHPRAVLLLTIKAVSGIPIGIFQAMFSVVAMDTFHLAPDENGYLMSYIGVLSMITQGIGIGFLVKRVSESTIIKLSVFILVLSYLLLAFTVTVVQLCLVMIPMCIGLTLLSVIISSALTHTVSDQDTGLMLGLNMAVNSMIRTLSPTAGGYMLSYYGFSSFGYLGFVSNLVVSLYLFMKRAEL